VLANVRAALDASAVTSFDALLVVSFGGPERPDDVMPFLENVVRGRNVPRERLLAVAEHYHLLGGKSPINERNRDIVRRTEALFAERGPVLPIYFGNRNWHPFLEDTLREMRDAGVRRALAFITAAHGSYSGCRQYREDLERARAKVEHAPEIVPLRRFYDHPRFLEANADHVRRVSSPAARLVFTAHSIPVSMAESSPYARELELSAREVARRVGALEWDLVYQSRSGPPEIPWLEPDVLDHLRASRARGASAVVLAPIGFVSDHMEIVYDLDHEARGLANELGLGFARAETAGTHPAFIEMIRDLVLEATDGVPPALVDEAHALSGRCTPTCCPAPRRRP
jgi:ferrochelatase